MVAVLGGTYAFLAALTSAAVVSGWSRRDRWGLLVLAPLLVTVPLTALSTLHRCAEGSPIATWAVPAVLALPLGFFGPLRRRLALLAVNQAAAFALSTLWTEQVHGEVWSGTDRVTFAQQEVLEPGFARLRDLPEPVPAGEVWRGPARMGVRAAHTWWTGLHPREDVVLVLTTPGGTRERALADAEVEVRRAP